MGPWSWVGGCSAVEGVRTRRRPPGPHQPQPWLEAKPCPPRPTPLCRLVLPPALEFAAAASTAPDPRVRRAGCVALLVVVEGCADGLRPRLADPLAVVAAGLRDPAPGVRGQAAFALGQLAEHCQPEAR